MKTCSHREMNSHFIIQVDFQAHSPVPSPHVARSGMAWVFSNMCIFLWPSHTLGLHVAMRSIKTCARGGFLNGSFMLSCIIHNRLAMMRQKKKEK